MLDPGSYLLASKIFVQLLGLIHLIASGSFLLQIRGLIGRGGILPLKNYLGGTRDPKRWFYRPTLFWLNTSDTALLIVNSLGVICSIFLLFGYFPTVNLILLYLIWLSIVYAGQDFMSFGWEMFLLELTFNGIFLSMTDTPNLMIWLSVNFLIIRFHIQAGAVKLQSQDPNWRNQTALWYHYFTQPIPNMIAWYIHKLPLWFHQLSCILMFVIELVIPFLVLGNQEMRLAAWFCFVGLQFFIWLTGNFSYLNYMTVAFCTILLSDNILSPLTGSPATPDSTPLSLTIFLSIVGGGLILLQFLRFWTSFKWNPTFLKILDWVEPFHIINRYGIFAIMTTERFEIVIEGSEDGENWKEYLFKHKPSEVSRRPRRISPFQPRLDWQAWFLPFTSFGAERWFVQFLTCLLEGKPRVLGLLRHNPFPEKPPKYLRASMYDYTYTSWKEKNKTGNWWNRRYTGPYSSTLHISRKTS